MAYAGFRPSEVMRAQPDDVLPFLDLPEPFCFKRVGKGGVPAMVPLPAEGVEAWRLLIARQGWGRFQHANINRDWKHAMARAGETKSTRRRGQRRSVQKLERPHLMETRSRGATRACLFAVTAWTGQRAHTERRHLLVPAGRRVLIRVRDRRDEATRDPRPSKPMIAGTSSRNRAISFQDTSYGRRSCGRPNSGNIAVLSPHPPVLGPYAPADRATLIIGLAGR